MEARVIAMVATEGRASQQLAATTGATVVSTAMNCSSTLVTPLVGVFYRVNRPGAADPVALADGTDTYLLPNITVRIQHARGIKFGFLAKVGTGDVHITAES